MFTTAAFYLVVLVPELLGKQVGEGLEDSGMIYQPTTQKTKLVLTLYQQFFGKRESAISLAHKNSQITLIYQKV